MQNIYQRFLSHFPCENNNLFYILRNYDDYKTIEIKYDEEMRKCLDILIKEIEKINIKIPKAIEDIIEAITI